MEEIPVYLFTGFMDSGKTSLIRQTLLEDKEYNNGRKRHTYYHSHHHVVMVGKIAVDCVIDIEFERERKTAFVACAEVNERTPKVHPQRDNRVNADL